MEHTTESETTRTGARSRERSEETAGSERAASDESSLARLHRTAGNRAVGALFRRGELRAGLAVSSPGDPAERVADRVADRVMRGPDPDLAVDAASGTDDGGESSALAGEIEGTIRSVRGGGRPLPEPTRSFFESRFGRDLSAVRVHTGARADAAARSLGAEAFTLGTDVVFRRDAFAPATGSGRELLAHELAHVLQGDAGTVFRSVADGAQADDRGPGRSRGQSGEFELPEGDSSADSGQASSRPATGSNGSPGAERDLADEPTRTTERRQEGSDEASEAAQPAASGGGKGGPERNAGTGGTGRDAAETAAADSRRAAAGEDVSSVDRPASEGAPGGASSVGQPSSAAAPSVFAVERSMPVPAVERTVALDVPTLPRPEFPATDTISPGLLASRAEQATTALTTQLAEKHRAIDRVQAEQLQRLEVHRRIVSQRLERAYSAAASKTTAHADRTRTRMVGRTEAASEGVQRQGASARSRAVQTTESAREATATTVGNEMTEIRETVEDVVDEFVELGRRGARDLEAYGERKRDDISRESGENPRQKLSNSIERQLWVAHASDVAFEEQSKIEASVERIREDAPQTVEEVEQHLEAEFGDVIDEVQRQADQGFSERVTRDRRSLQERESEALDTTRAVERQTLQQFDASRAQAEEALVTALERIRENVVRTCQELKNEATRVTQQAVDRVAEWLAAVDEGEASPTGAATAFEEIPGRTEQDRLDPLLDRAASAIDESTADQLEPFEAALAAQLRRPHAQFDVVKTGLQEGAEAHGRAVQVVREQNRQQGERVLQQLSTGLEAFSSEAGGPIERLEQLYRERARRQEEAMDARFEANKREIERRVSRHLDDEVDERASVLEDQAAEIGRAMDAVTRFTVDEEAILDVLRQVTIGELDYLKKAYAEWSDGDPDDLEKLERDIEENVKELIFESEDKQAMRQYLQGNFEQARMTELDAAHKWYNTDEDRVIAIVESASDEQLDRMLADDDVDLEGTIDDMRGPGVLGLNVHEQEIVDTLVHRDDGMGRREREIRVRALKLDRAAEGNTGIGTDETTIEQELRKSGTARERRYLRRHYREVSAEMGSYADLDAMVRGEFSVHAEDEKLALAQVDRSEERLAAARIAEAGHLAGTDEGDLVAQLATEVGVVREAGGGAIRGPRRRSSPGRGDDGGATPVQGALGAGRQRPAEGATAEEDGAGGERASASAGGESAGPASADAGGESAGPASTGAGVDVESFDLNWLGIYLEAMETTSNELRVVRNRGRGEETTATVEQLNGFQTDGEAAPLHDGKPGRELLRQWLASEMTEGPGQGGALAEEVTSGLLEGDLDDATLLLYAVEGGGTDDQLVKSALSDENGQARRKADLRDLDEEYQEAAEEHTGETQRIHERLGTSVRAGVGANETPSYSSLPGFGAGELSGKTQYEVELLLFGQPETPEDFVWLADWAETYAESGYLSWIPRLFGYDVVERLAHHSELLEREYEQFLASADFDEAERAEYERLVSKERVGDLTPAERERLRELRDQLPGSRLAEYERLRAELSELVRERRELAAKPASERTSEESERLAELEARIESLHARFEELDAALAEEGLLADLDRLQELRRKRSSREGLTEAERAELEELKSDPEIQGYVRIEDLEQRSEFVQGAADFYSEIKRSVVDTVALVVEVIGTVVVTLLAGPASAGNWARVSARLAAWASKVNLSRTAAVAAETLVGVAGTVVRAGSGPEFAEDLGKDLSMALVGGVGAGTGGKLANLKQLAGEIGGAVARTFRPLRAKLDGTLPMLRNAGDQAQRNADDLGRGARNQSAVDETSGNVETVADAVRAGDDEAAEAAGRQGFDMFDTARETLQRRVAEGTLVTAADVLADDETWDDMRAFNAASMEILSRLPGEVLASFFGAGYGRFISGRGGNPEAALNAFITQLVEVGGQSVGETGARTLVEGEDEFAKDLLVNLLRNGAMELPSAVATSYVQHRSQGSFEGVDPADLVGGDPRRRQREQRDRETSDGQEGQPRREQDQREQERQEQERPEQERRDEEDTGEQDQREQDGEETPDRRPDEGDSGRRSDEDAGDRPDPQVDRTLERPAERRREIERELDTHIVDLMGDPEARRALDAFREEFDRKVAALSRYRETRREHIAEMQPEARPEARRELRAELRDELTSVVDTFRDNVVDRADLERRVREPPDEEQSRGRQDEGDQREGEREPEQREPGDEQARREPEDGEDGRDSPDEEGRRQPPDDEQRRERRQRQPEGVRSEGDEQRQQRREDGRQRRDEGDERGRSDGERRRREEGRTGRQPTRESEPPALTDEETSAIARRVRERRRAVEERVDDVVRGELYAIYREEFESRARAILVERDKRIKFVDENRDRLDAPERERQAARRDAAGRLAELELEYRERIRRERGPEVASWRDVPVDRMNDILARSATRAERAVDVLRYVHESGGREAVQRALGSVDQVEDGVAGRIADRIADGERSLRDVDGVTDEAAEAIVERFAPRDRVQRLETSEEGQAPERVPFEEEISGAVVQRTGMGSGDAGPLPGSIAETFSGGRYATIRTTEPVTLYRVWNPGQNDWDGGYWSFHRPEGSLQARIDMALHPDWAQIGDTPHFGQASRVTAIEVPAGAQLHVGEVSSQSQAGAWVGGKSQVMFDQRVNEVNDYVSRADALEGTDVFWSEVVESSRAFDSPVQGRGSHREPPSTPDEGVQALNEALRDGGRDLGQELSGSTEDGGVTGLGSGLVGKMRREMDNGPFESVDDLVDRVSGIGPKRAERLVEYFRRPENVVGTEAWQRQFLTDPEAVEALNGALADDARDLGTELSEPSDADVGDLGPETVEKVRQERERGPFESVADLVNRVDGVDSDQARRLLAHLKNPENVPGKVRTGPTPATVDDGVARRYQQAVANRTLAELGTFEATDADGDVQTYDLGELRTIWASVGDYSRRQELVQAAYDGDAARLEDRGTEWASRAAELVRADNIERAAYIVASGVYREHRSDFWERFHSREDVDELEEALEHVGIVFGDEPAPFYEASGEKVTFEHVVRKVDDPSKALDPDNLVFSPASENSELLEDLRRLFGDEYEGLEPGGIGY